MFEADSLTSDPAAKSAVTFIVHRLAGQPIPLDTDEYIDQEMGIRHEARDLGILPGPMHDIEMSRALTRARSAIRAISEEAQALIDSTETP